MIRKALRSLRSVSAGLVVFGGLELLLARPTAVWSILFVLVGFVFIVLVSHGSRTWRSQTDRHVVVLSVVLTAASVGFLLFPAGRLIQHAAAVLLSLAIGFLVFLVRNPVNRGISGVRYTPPEAFVLLTAFLVLTDIVGLSLFFSYARHAANMTIMLLALCAAVVGLGYQFFFFQGLPKARMPAFLGVLGLLTVQAGWALAFWPTDAFSRGAVLFILFYLFVGLAKHAIRTSFTWRIFGEYMTTSAVVLVAMLTTTQWTF